MTAVTGEPDVELRVVEGPRDRAVVERLWQLYHHDLSQFRGSLPDDEGLFQSRRLPAYLDDPDGVSYLLVLGDRPVGFALVRGLDAEQRTICEFFVVRAARRRRCGYDAALQVLRLHPGRWEIAFQEENPGAARFWRQVATAASGSSWTQERRPVPDKPHLPHDVWLSLDTADTGDLASG